MTCVICLAQRDVSSSGIFHPRLPSFSLSLAHSLGRRKKSAFLDSLDVNNSLFRRKSLEFCGKKKMNEHQEGKKIIFVDFKHLPCFSRL